MTVEFRNAGGKTTKVVLTHELFTDAARLAGHESGWTQLLRLLDRLMTEKTV
ncbi:MAG: SRPBCC domain-containing protein [Gemmatimonadota bacterium]|nr:SRPBCC domain-containing protein [Gemmatimonadota bacterium]